ncbi:arylesterase [Motilimonas cestriensis]|uniref:Arylesterase n=1 Tax=Motilimonas cestriensis TaxID=2742685 RepID=A0ABS8WFX3_9GAMM|nr:arylesterase [Motilimonas cestriensis]MCE2596646.1 arylesterase [Motilimonas cestriensis]
MRTLPLRVWYFLILGFCCLITACSDSSQKIKLTQDSLIVAFGDSLTQGIGASPTESYPSILSQQLGVSVINKGVSGETSAQGLARLEAILNETAPDLVILCYGGNDLLRKLPLSELERNLEQMINLIKSYHAEVILVGVPKPAIFLSSVPLYEELAERHQLVAELNVLSDLLDQKTMKSDAVHLNSKGYQAFASALAKKIDIQ